MKTQDDTTISQKDYTSEKERKDSSVPVVTKINQ